MPAQYKNAHPGEDPWTAKNNTNAVGNVPVHLRGGQDAPGRDDWAAARDAHYNEKKQHVTTADDPVSINPDNYKVAGEGDYLDVRRRADVARGRGGVQIQNQRADDMLASQFQARARQQEAAGLHGAAIWGLAPSESEQYTRMALDQQTQANARAAALAGGDRAIASSNPALAQALAQGSMGRQNETQQAFVGHGQVLTGMRGQDIVGLRQAQEAALAQAGLESSQRGRNDALARAYASEENNLALEQLAADQAYEAQANENRLGVLDQNERRRQDQAQRTWDAYRKGARVVGTILGGMAGR